MPPRTHPLGLEPIEDRTAPTAGLDVSFGNGGVAVVSVIRPFARPVDMAVQPDGKLVVLIAGGPVTVARLNADGSPDLTFGGGDGVYDSEGLPPPTDYSFSPTAVASGPDGSITVLTKVSSSPKSPPSPAVVRLTPAGDLDRAFGANGNGVAFLDFNVQFSPWTFMEGLTVRPDGGVLAVGSYIPVGNGASELATVSLKPDGSRESGVGSFGLSRYPLGLAAVVGDLILPGPDNTFWAVGRVLAGPSVFDAIVVRLTAAGHVDPTFGDGGKAVVPLGGPGVKRLSAAPTPDGGLVLGLVGAGGVAPTVVRLTPSGSPDPTFDGDGRIELTDPSMGPLVGVAALTDGRVLASAGIPGGGFAVLALSPAGVPDLEFGPDGWLRAADPPADRFEPLQQVGPPFGAITPLPDGQIAIFGRTLDPAAAVAVVTPSLPPPPVAESAAVGGSLDGTARVLTPAGGKYSVGGSLSFFPGLAANVRIATADVTGDGVPDYVAGTGPGFANAVSIIDGATQKTLVTFAVFESHFVGGLFVAAADLDGDGKAEVVVTPDQSGGPVVAIYRGSKLAAGVGGQGAQMARFFGIQGDPNFRGGCRPALGDLNRDGVPDLIIAAGVKGGPRIALFDGTGLATGGDSPPKLRGDFFAFESSLRNGSFVAAGDVTGDGVADIAFGGGPRGAPRVRLFDGKALVQAGEFANVDEIGSAQRANYFAGDPTLRGGVRLTLRDVAGDGRADLITGSGEGEASRVRVYRSENLLTDSTPWPDQELDPFSGVVLANGIFVG